MSGGAWNYLEYKLEEVGEAAARAGEGMKLLAAIEHEMDWGISGDTCQKCAENRVVSALYHYFGDGGYGIEAAVAIVRDHTQNRCPKDLERLSAVSA